MTVALRLLDEVSWQGSPVPGQRPARLLAALVLHPTGLTDAALVDEVWDTAAPPVSPGKALQVLVSRIRAQCGAEVIERYDGGYRLGLPADEVDALLRHRLVDEAARALDESDPQRAVSLTDEASALCVAEPGGAADGPLTTVRTQALGLERRLTRVRGLALSASGRDVDALPLLVEAHRVAADDARVLVALLRGEAVAEGVPTALTRYQDYRRDLADRLGVDPDPALQRVHRELLASDEPIRSGVRYEADDLLGRTGDLARLGALVRTGRLTSIIGPGGLGKTRIAHVLAREAVQPRVHFVELVGIASQEDVVSEVGSALGVRHSVTSRRALTPAQQADVRGRIAQELDAVPTLLVLDNCEHVLDAVASLVAFLLVTTRDLRVVTTSRAPLAIAAERVFPLSQLADDDGMELFRRRAYAVRPEADLPDEVVREIVGRLDGLPLAVELAAARIRTMSAEEVRRALDDRFGLLRGRDRSAPARHQTLTAVIGWSWDLLGADEQRALRWLSLFQDGFSVGAAEVVLGPGARVLVEALVDQSLLNVVEHAGVTRHRMLETVREFGVLRLTDAGEVDVARAAQTRWAVGLAERVRPELFGRRQVEIVDLLMAEETNLSDVLRRTLVASAAEDAVQLLAALGGLWSVTGKFARFLTMSDLSERLLVDWHPPPELEEVTGEAVALVLTHLAFMRPDDVEDLTQVLLRLPPGTHPWTRVARAMFVSATSPSERRAAVLELTDDADLRVAAMAWQWAAVLAENEGEVEAAQMYLRRALSLVDEDTTTWEVATLHTQLATWALNSGDHDAAARHARVAIPLLTRLYADDDAFSMRASLALSALRQGRVDEAARMLDEVGEPAANDMTAGLVKTQVAAELAVVRGDVVGALATFEQSLNAMRDWRFAGMTLNGLEPWTLISLAADLGAHVRLGLTAEHRARAGELAAETSTVLSNLETMSDVAIDFPVTGMALAALSAWCLTERVDEQQIELGVRLLALAQAFGYNRWFPVMAWEPFSELADDAAPGRLAAVLEEYGERRGRELRPEAERVLGLVDVTSCG